MRSSPSTHTVNYSSVNTLVPESAQDELKENTTLELYCLARSIVVNHNRNFHNSWDALMPIIEDIEALIEGKQLERRIIAGNFYFSLGTIKILFEDGERYYVAPNTNNRLKNAWLCCVDFASKYLHGDFDKKTSRTYRV